MAPPITCVCGECHKCKHREYMRGYYRRNSEVVKQTSRESRLRNIERAREYDRERSRTPERIRHLTENTSAWRKKNPEKWKAQIILNNAVRDGKIEKEPCEICGDEYVHAHHDDYNKPLEVRWLCPIHHAAERL